MNFIFLNGSIFILEFLWIFVFMFSTSCGASRNLILSHRNQAKCRQITVRNGLIIITAGRTLRTHGYTI